MFLTPQPHYQSTNQRDVTPANYNTASISVPSSVIQSSQQQRSHSTPAVSLTSALLSRTASTPLQQSALIPYSLSTTNGFSSSSASTPSIPLPILTNAVQSLLPLLKLGIVDLSTALASPASNNDYNTSAITASRTISALPSQGAVALSSPPLASAPLTVDESGSGAVTRLLSGLLWALEHVPSIRSATTDISTSNSSVSETALPSSHPAYISLLLAIQHAASQPAMRLALLQQGALKIVAKVAMDAWNTLDQLVEEYRTGLFTPSLVPASPLLPHLGSLLSSTIDTMLELTGVGGLAPIGSTQNSLVAALINRIGKCIIQGPEEVQFMLSPNSSDKPPSSIPTLFVQSLHLLGNLVALSNSVKTFVKSNNTATIASTSSTTESNSSTTTSSSAASTTNNSSTNPHFTSTSLSTIPLKSLYRSLIASLSSSSFSLVLHSLRLVSHLAVNDGVGGMERKLFSGSNLNNTFQLVFNLIIQTSTNTATLHSSNDGNQAAFGNSGSIHLLRPAVDIFHVFLQSNSLVQSLCAFPSFNACLKGLLRIVEQQTSAMSSMLSVNDTSSSVAGYDSGNSNGSNVALSLLELIHAFASTNRALARKVATFFFAQDEESLDILLGCMFVKHVPLACQSIQILLTLIQCIDASAAGEQVDDNTSETASAASAPDVSTLHGRLHEQLSELCEGPFKALTRFLSLESFLAAQRHDTEIARDSLLVQHCLQQSTTHAPVSTVSVTATSAAAARNQVSHECFLLLVIDLFILLAQTPSLRVHLPLNPSELLHTVSSLRNATENRRHVDTSTTPLKTSPQVEGLTSPEAAFALVHLLSLFRSDPKHQQLLHSFFESFLSISSFHSHNLDRHLGDIVLAAEESNTPSSAAASAATLRKGGATRDALYFVHLTLEISSQLQTHRVNVRWSERRRSLMKEYAVNAQNSKQKLTASQQHALEQSWNEVERVEIEQAVNASRHEILELFIAGLSHAQARRPSKDTQRLSSALAMCRSQLAQLNRSISDLTQAAGQAQSESNSKEQELNRRMKAMEESFQQTLAAKDQEIRELKSSHANQLQSVEADLTSRFHSLHTNHEAHLDRLQALENEWGLSQQRAQAAERKTAELREKLKKQQDKYQVLQNNYQGLQTKLENTQQENAQLFESLENKALELVKSSEEVQELRQREHAHSSVAEAKLQDSYQKLILLNRAYQELRSSSDDNDRNQRAHQEEISNLSKQLSSSKNNLLTTQAKLDRVEEERDRFQLELSNVARDKEELVVAFEATRHELESATNGREDALAREQILLQQQDVLQRAQQELHQKFGILSEQLAQSELELKQHHQLAAMIHKLSGQATSNNAGH